MSQPSITLFIKKKGRPGPTAVMKAMLLSALLVLVVGTGSAEVCDKEKLGKGSKHCVRRRRAICGGLHNVGNSCFLNVVIQLCRASHFSNELLTRNPHPAILQLDEVVWCHPDKGQLSRLLRLLPEPFNSGRQQDPSELLELFILQESGHRPVALVHKTTVLKCYSCNGSREVPDDGSTLCLHLTPSSSKATVQSMPSLLMALEAWEDVTVDCDTCGPNLQHQKKTQLARGPLHRDLLFVIDRFSADGRKRGFKVDILPRVTMNNESYDLSVVVHHLGRTRDSGHSVAMVREGGVWVRYNDDAVSRHANPVHGPHDTPYMLLYRHVENQESPPETPSSTAADGN
eukprot:TRINITY_DN10332_c0_g1_i1.p1 TRINITY_DN10332_c0_g1~~TRINITY_DN10332_c0_g1_i1.p1  ORF type:complete len:344 (-),score=8.50 TRINITY_DN10332_c0_g1_i1:197-1228(-)